MNSLREFIRHTILEVWSRSDDFSKYGKRYISLDGTTDYPDESIAGQKTHGFYSHAIKHAEEFDRAVVDNCFENIKQYIMSKDFGHEVYRYGKNKNLIPLISMTPKQWHKAMQSLLDNINDIKILEHKKISLEQEKIWKMAQPIWDLYANAEKELKQAEAIDISDYNFKTVEELRSFLLSKKGTGIVVHWLGSSPKRKFEVKFKPDDTTYMSYNGEEVYTLMKLNKTPRGQNMDAALKSQAKHKSNGRVMKYLPTSEYSNFSLLCQAVYDEGKL